LPLFAFAGICTTFNGDRGTKSKPITGPHQVYGFLTTEANALVKPIHPKAMPVMKMSSTLIGCSGIAAERFDLLGLLVIKSGELIARVAIDPQQFVELRMDSLRVAVFGPLDEQSHQ
jgi:hypothetical protein